MEFRNIYVDRHDRIVEHIRNEIMKQHPHVTVFSDQPITGDLLDSRTNFQFIHHRKPDLLICDRLTMKSFIVEVSCPFDAFVNTCYTTKFNIYQPLNELINVSTPYSCKTIVIIIGSLGTIHKRVTSGLKMLGIPNRRCISKAIAKYISISAAIGSNIIWKKRARFVFS